MTEGRNARTSVEAILYPDSVEARNARTSVEAIISPDAVEARLARMSVEVLVRAPTGIGAHWGIPWR